jgi:1,4-dihydroxy-2-naphthoate octaprenyltransferase
MTPAEPRPLIERLGLAVIALVVTAMFGAIALAALGGGELFLGVMAGIGAVMTVWASVSTLRRG